MTAQKMKFFIKNLFNKYDQIRSFLWVWSHLLKNFLIENFICCYCARIVFAGSEQVFNKTLHKNDFSSKSNLNGIYVFKMNNKNITV